MKIVTKDKKVIYINLNNMDTVSIQPQSRYTKQNETDIFYCVMVSNGMCNTCVYESNMEQEAKDVLLDIGILIEESEPQKTYLDGFKDGTEYALKLIKENK
jgi:hypothetical protein